MIVYTVGIVNTLIDCPTKNIPFYFISPISKKFISEILDIAGIKTNQIRALNKRERVKFKNLWCPIMPVSYGLGTHHTSTDFFARFREATGIPQELPTLLVIKDISPERCFLQEGFKRERNHKST